MADHELERWSQIFSGSSFYYGTEPGPVARRAVRYHKPLAKPGARALDAGCGEGQDLLFLAQCGYDVTGVEFTPTGAAKTRRLLESNGMPYGLHHVDLRHWDYGAQYELVLAVNVLQFLGADAPAALERLLERVAPGGVAGLSVFARADAAEDPCQQGIYRWTLEEMLATVPGWQPLEAALLYQWGATGPQPFVTLIAAKP